MSATDLSQLNEIQIDYSSVEINTAGEYTAKASVEDINKNKTEKEFKVTVVQPSTDENTETTTEVQTDPTTGQKKTVVVSKPKITQQLLIEIVQTRAIHLIQQIIAIVAHMEVQEVLPVNHPAVEILVEVHQDLRVVIQAHHLNLQKF